MHGYCWAAYHKRCYELAQEMKLVPGKTAPVEYASDEQRPPIMDLGRLCLHKSELLEMA